MDGSLTASRITAAKIAAAVVVAGAVSIAATACGSGSGSASSAPRKQAGLTKGVSLTVVNKDRDHSIYVSICAKDHGGCTQTRLYPGHSASIAGDAVDGYLHPVGGIYARILRIDAYNPVVGLPAFKLCDKQKSPECQVHPLSEGERVTSSFNGSPLVLSRAGDTSDHKVLGMELG